MTLPTALLLLLLAAPALAVWPKPAHMTTGASAVRLAPSFMVQLSVANPPQDLVEAIARTEYNLGNDRHRRLVVGRGKDNASAITSAPQILHLNLQLAAQQPVRSIAEETSIELENRREEYSLDIPADGQDATLTANTTLGLFRGLTTFEQLFYTLGADVYTIEAPISIQDAPGFPYRGLMLDTARNFYSVSDLKRTFDAMSMVKLSQFHWHVTDSQSFPVEVPGMPEIAQKGSFDEELIYTAEDVDELAHYAASRGIDIIMEIDMPGHTGSIVTSHPEHVACGWTDNWGGNAAEPPSGQLRVASAATQNFTNNMLSALAGVMPGKYFSTGGDEVNEGCYGSDQPTQADLKASGKTLRDTISSFVQSTHQTLGQKGKTPVVWEEMVLAHDIPVPNNTLVTVWISSGNSASVTAKGLRVVQAPSAYFYLDCGAGGWLGAGNGGSWCDPFKSWGHVYSYEPYSGIPDAQHKLIVGGQTLLWSEQSSPENLDSIVWPRTAALAEVFWSPLGERNGVEASARMHDVRYRMVQRGIRATAMQPHWCALRPGKCN
ncbi:N-acetylhexosaminidase [Auriculariales sp. MPI-PUGE-AT-0066]|nr:N-acetylhexosaminidase [Auriculariales sp. MPI-PUGE-AT-0066]